MAKFHLKDSKGTKSEIQVYIISWVELVVKFKLVLPYPVLHVFALNAFSFETYRSVGTSSCLTQSKWHSLMAWQSYAVESFQTRKHKQFLTGFNAASYSSATDIWYKFRDLVGSLMVFRSTHVPSIGKFANDIWSNSWNNWKILKVSSWTRRFGWSLHAYTLFEQRMCRNGTQIAAVTTDLCATWTTRV